MTTVCAGSGCQVRRTAIRVNQTAVVRLNEVKHQFGLMDVDVFQIPGKTWWVRYSDVHGWGCQTNDGPLWFKERGIYMPLLPLLELDLVQARGLVEASVEARRLSRSVADGFPYMELIVYALAWETDGWPKNAIEWLEEGFPVNREIACVLERLSLDARRGQRLRHSARVLAKRWNKGNV